METPQTVRRVDTTMLLYLESRAHEQRLKQYLPVSWCEDNVDPRGQHLLHPVVEHTLSHRRELPSHWRCELLVALRGGRVVLSLLDVMPSDFDALPDTLSSDEKRGAMAAIQNAPTVAEWARQHG